MKPPAKAKAKPAQKRKQVNSDDSDSDSGDLMSRLKSKTTAGGKVRFYSFVFLFYLLETIFTDIMHHEILRHL